MLRPLQFLLRSFMLVGLCAVLAGCGTVRLPAIDPTGERVFLPDPSYTTMVSPYDSTGIYSCFPEPAFTEPPPIPPCPDVLGAAPAGTGIAAPAPQSRLLLTPSKIIAPINSEVVLLAGI